MDEKNPVLEPKYEHTAAATEPSRLSQGVPKTLTQREQDEYDPLEGRRDDTDDDPGVQPSCARYASEPPLAKLKTLSYTLKGWWQELLWCLVSIGALIALVVVLRHFDGKPLPRWPSGITLNTVIALLSTVCRAAFVEPVMEGLAQYKWLWFKRSGRPLRDYVAFENASRGPWGTLQLVFTTRVRALGILPALLLVSALLTSTLTQSTVTYPERRIAVLGENIATIERTDEYYWATANMQGRIGREAPIAQAVMQALNTPAEQPIPYADPVCRSSNCTWDQFSTLSVCVQMNNVTELLDIEELSEEGAVPQVRLTLPNNITMTKSNFGYGDFAIQVGSTLSFDDTEEIKGSIFDFFVLRIAFYNSGYEHSSIRSQATEILLHWCVDTYDVDVTDNVPHVNLVSSDTHVEQGEVYVRSYNMTVNMTYLTSPHDPDTKYPADGQGIQSIQDILSSSLVGQFPDAGGPQFSNGTELFASAMHSFRLSSYDEFDGNDDEAEWVAMRNMSQNIASSLTNMLFLTEVNGTAWETETYVSVRWEWLSLLAVQVLIAISILVFVMVATARSGIGIVKSSPLPGLFAISAEQKLSWEMEQRDQPATQRSDEVMNSAGGVVGRLVRKGKMWEIR